MVGVSVASSACTLPVSSSKVVSIGRTQTASFTHPQKKKLTDVNSWTPSYQMERGTSAKSLLWKLPVQEAMKCHVKMWQHSILLEQCAIRALFFQNKITMRNPSNISRYTKPFSMSTKKEKRPTLFVWIQHQSHWTWDCPLYHQPSMPVDCSSPTYPKMPRHLESGLIFKHSFCCISSFDVFKWKMCSTLLCIVSKGETS